MVGELAEGVLCPARGEDRRAQLEAIRALVVAVFDRYPTPASLDAPAWRELRARLDRHLQLVGLHPPKRAKDVPEPFAEDYVNLMPIHEKLRGRDAPTLHNYLRATMCNVHDELSKRVDAAAVAASLRARHGARVDAAATGDGR